ncbi:MAG: hypothetical protein R3F39_15890 [Myxococcota bacterium]
MNALRTAAAACLLALSATATSYAVEPFQPDGPSDTVTPQPVETAAPIEAAIEDGDEAEEEKGFFERKHKGYLGYMFGELEKIGELDIYGVSGQLPKGYLGFKYQWTTIKAGARFGENGTKGPVATPIEFTNSNGDKVVSIDLGLSGKGHGHNFMVSYGISNPVDFYIELPFTFMDVKLQPNIAPVNANGDTFDPTFAKIAGYNPQTYGANDFLFDTLPRLGRATPPTRYVGKWLLGDVNMGFSWNYQRNRYFSNSMTARVFLPTGKIQNPNNSLLFGTGPGLDTSIGGWAAGWTHGFDVRLLNKGLFGIVLSNEMTFSYGFKQKRPYPTNFMTPDPSLAALDPASFPDLSNLEGTFSYTPGFSVDASVQLQFQIASLGVGAAYGISYSQTPWLDGDRDFLSMAKSLELIGQSSQQILQLGATLSLLPFVPASIGFSWQKAVKGNNAIVFDDYFQITVQAFAPLYKLWTKE